MPALTLLLAIVYMARWSHRGKWSLGSKGWFLEHPSVHEGLTWFHCHITSGLKNGGLKQEPDSHSAHADNVNLEPLGGAA